MGVGSARPPDSVGEGVGVNESTHVGVALGISCQVAVGVAISIQVAVAVGVAVAKNSVGVGLM